MKNIYHLTLLLLLVGISLPTALRSQNALCFPYFVHDNQERLLTDIEAWYGDHFGEPNFYDVGDAMAMIRPFIANLPETPTFNEDCNQGKFLATGRTYSAPYEHSFRWERESDESSAYNSNVLDLRIEPKTTEINQSIIGGAQIQGEDPNIGKLFAFNVTCPETGQSSYYIIIIDRDIGIGAINDICYPAEVTLNPNSGGLVPMPLPKLQLSETKLSLFPNPTIDGQVQVNLDLAKESLATLQIYAASSGKLMTSIFAQQKIEQGNYQHSISGDQLSAGLYYVVLQTEEKRIVKKLTKL